MTENRIVDRAEWLAARRALLEQEKALTRQRDALSAARRALPWVRLDKEYAFEDAGGRVSLADLFDGKGQLLVYHFMMGPTWEEGCPSCSFWADNFDGIDIHLAHRDTALVAVSRAPLERIEAYRRRMGWTFRWVSSAGSDFNVDFAVSFDPAGRREGERNYNFGTVAFAGEEAPGVSAFRRGADGSIFHTYSTYGRGLDTLNGVYQLLDLTAKGRDEEGLPWPMAWVRRHDRY
ncbi:MAG: thioredoxin family protein [Reyranellaceae bacterium]